ncbi:hypothetical protein TL16_g09994 [Triparma laevis f. inornata]|uniref:Uncharacterized protein n=1 Tax=Triparma laevis f. inornata TaxID=1714386 RepID=A0A9W7EN65_9STRA|nr:hypothetical protein TL16_g09994 [Triparma laevis f. inornata]
MVEKLKDELIFGMDVACGGASTSILSDQGDVWSWGWNFYGQCGVSKRTMGNPGGGEELGMMSGFGSTGSGFDSPQSHFDNYGSAGDNLDKGEGGEVENILVPTATLVGKVVTSLSLGFAHGACVSAVGELFTWGFNEEGQLGLGHEENVYKPEIVGLSCEWGGERLSSDERGDSKIRVLAVACGHTHTACVVSKLSSVQNDLRRRDADFRRKAATVLLRFGKWCIFCSLRRKKYGRVRRVEVVEVKEVEEIDLEATRRKREQEEEEERRKREAVLAERRRAEELLEKKRLEEEERIRLAEEEAEEEAERFRLERRREETERMLMKREDDFMRRFINDERLAMLAKEEERERRRKLEAEEEERFRENELMRLEDERGRLAVAYRRMKWEEMKRAKEERFKAKEDERLAREAKRLMDVKKAADRLKNAREKAAEKKERKAVPKIKRSGSAGGVGLGNGMEERLKLMAEEKRLKEEMEAREREKREKREEEERLKAEMKRAKMIEKREQRLRLEREEEERERARRLEEERGERELEKERGREEGERLREEEKERLRRAEKLKRLARRGSKDLMEENIKPPLLGEVEKPVFHSAHQWGRKLSKTGGRGGNGGVVRGSKNGGR